MSNWFKLVKRVLRSPSKAHEKKSSRRREECEAEEEEKKREKKRWLLGRSSKAISSHVEQTVGRDAAEILEVQTRHALAAAAATVEAAAATAEAAAEIVKLARRPCRHLRVARDIEQYAAVIIQAAFRGYLARRAFHALRGLVKLQALVRGHNVRKQTKVVLKYMQALVRVQERLLHQQRTSLKSHDTNNISWESKHQILRERSRTMEGRRSIRNQSIGGHEGDHEVFEDRAKWLDGCPPSAPWDNCNRRASADNHYNSNFSTSTSPIFTKRHQHYHEHHHKPPLSPLHHRAGHDDDDEETTPSPLKTFRTSYSAANTPALPRRSSCMIIDASSHDTLPLPNYMAFTESAKAKARSSPAGLRSERGGNDGSTAKKRLSYYNPTAPETTESLRSPSFKSLPMDRDYSNYYSVSQILSPCSTTDLRWLN